MILPVLLLLFLLTDITRAAAIAHKNHFSRLYQQNKYSESKVKFRQASNHCKRLLEAAKLAYANKTKKSIISQKPGIRDFWRIANSVLNKDKSALLLLFNGQEVLPSASDKAKLVAKNFPRNSNFDDSGISLHAFPSSTNLKLHNITRNFVKKVITNLGLSKAFGPDCIPVVVLKKLRTSTFLHTSCTPQYVFEKILSSRLLEVLISAPCI